MSRPRLTALTPETVVIGQQRPKVRVQIRAESSTGRAGGKHHETRPSVVVYDLDLELVYKTVIDALRALAEKT